MPFEKNQISNRAENVEPLRQAIYAEMMRMLARNASGAPAADELPVVCDVMVEDYLRLPGARADADGIGRVRAAFRAYVQAGHVDFPGLSHLIPFLPVRSGAFQALPALPSPGVRDIGSGGRQWVKFMDEFRGRPQR